MPVAAAGCSLSCLNKDSMLSHAMVIPIVAAALPFTIGRSKENEANSFGLDGMGIAAHHCVFEKQEGAATDKGGGAPALTVRPLAPGAALFVNGQALHESEGGSAAPFKLNREP